MRRASLAFFSSAFALSLFSVSASAQNDTFAAVPYDVYDRSVIDARAEMQPISAAASTQSARRIYEHAFFTPVANFQQAGYQCGGMVSVSYSGGVRHLHRGTYCMR
jgi:hypothetical protein